MAIVFHCVKCGKRFDLDDAMAGKRARCKDCGTVFRIPDHFAAAAQSAAPPKPTPVKRTPVAKISFACTRCGRAFAVGPEMAGKRVRCKQCALISVVPEAPEPAPAPPRRAAPRSSRSSPPVGRPSPAVEDPFGLEEEVRSNSTSTPSHELGEELLPPQTDWMKRPPAERRSARRASSVEGPPWWIYVLINAGITVVICLLIALMPAQVKAIATLVTVVGFALTATGNIWSWVVAFRESAGTGLMYLFVPFYSVYYLISRWDTMRNPFFVSFTGYYTLMAFALFLPAVQAARNAAQREAQAQNPAFPGQNGANPANLRPGWPPNRPGGPPPEFGLPEFGNEKTVTVVVTGVEDEYFAEYATGELLKLVSPKGPGGYASRREKDGTVTLDVAPVGDPRAFAEMITFGKVVSVKGRVITMTAEPVPEAARDELIAKHRAEKRRNRP